MERGDFAYRISRASIVEDGAFSEFRGCDRVLVLLDGDGIELRHADPPTSIELRTGVLHAFSGDGATSARLLGSHVRDFNVIVSRPRARVVACEMVERRATIAIAGTHLYCHVVSGEFEIATVGLLKAFDSAWWCEGRVPRHLELSPLTPGARAIVVALAVEAPTSS